MLHKALLPDRIVTARTVIRKAKAEDPDQIAAWPAYPSSSRFNGKRMIDFPREPDGLFWWQQIERPERCHYSVADPQTNEVIGVYAFVKIDWQRRISRNMGCFIRPDRCFQGYGTETLQPLLVAVLQVGMRIVRLDVDADNPPAIRCYQKCGMQIVDEMRDENDHLYEMEIAVQPYQSLSFDPANVDNLLKTDPAMITRHLTMFLNTGIVRHPIHALLHAAACRHNVADLEILEHTLLSYDGTYVHEDTALLREIVKTLAAVNAPNTQATLNMFRHKLSHIELTLEDTDIYRAQNIERLISLCQQHEA
jgi:RimJ/RimL family protein N-acetyltransferase